MPGAKGTEWLELCQGWGGLPWDSSKGVAAVLWCPWTPRVNPPVWGHAKASPKEPLCGLWGVGHSAPVMPWQISL